MTVQIEKKLDATPEGIAEAICNLKVAEMVDLQREMARRGVELHIQTPQYVGIAETANY